MVNLAFEAAGKSIPPTSRNGLDLRYMLISAKNNSYVSKKLSTSYIAVMSEYRLGNVMYRG